MHSNPWWYKLWLLVKEAISVLLPHWCCSSHEHISPLNVSTSTNSMSVPFCCFLLLLFSPHYYLYVLVQDHLSYAASNEERGGFTAPACFLMHNTEDRNSPGSSPEFLIILPTGSSVPDNWCGPTLQSKAPAGWEARFKGPVLLLIVMEGKYQPGLSKWHMNNTQVSSVISYFLLSRVI